jgi:hypothetical protein
MRPRTDTRISLHDTIGPHPVTATRVTSEPATLVTNLYGHVADQVHQRDRPAAGTEKIESRRDRTLPQCGTRGSGSLTQTDDPRVGDTRYRHDSIAFPVRLRP